MSNTIATNKDTPKHFKIVSFQYKKNQLCTMAFDRNVIVIFLEMKFVIAFISIIKFSSLHGTKNDYNLSLFFNRYFNSVYFG